MRGTPLLGGLFWRLCNESAMTECNSSDNNDVQEAQIHATNIRDAAAVRGTRKASALAAHYARTVGKLHGLAVHLGGYTANLLASRLVFVRGQPEDPEAVELQGEQNFF